MKKTKRFLAIILTLAIITPATALVAQQGIAVTINGNPVKFEDQQPTNIDGRVLVPVRGVFEELGFTADWNGAIQQVTLTNDINTIIMHVGSAEFTMNGTTHELDVPAQLVNGRTMVPLRAPLESVGYGLDWDGSTQTVVITTNNDNNNSPSTANPINRSQITLPNRMLTEAERQEWIDEYWAMGGPTETEREVLRLINEIRAEHGLHALTLDYTLSLAARFYTQQKVQLSLGLGHGLGPYYSLEAYQAGVNGVPGAFGANVNSSVGDMSSSSRAYVPVNRWMASTGHRAALLSSTNHFAGVGNFGGVWYIYFHFRSNDN